MTAPADRILTNVEVHTLVPEGDTVHEAVAVRDGRVVRVGSAYEVAFLRGVETTVHDCEGAVVLPGFVDAHTHLDMVGRYLVHAALGDVAGPDEAVDRLRESGRSATTRSGEAAEAHPPTEGEWIVGFGYDESTWDDPRYLTREDLDRVSEDRPVAAFREDVHTVSLNGVALDRLADDIADGNLRRAGGEPTGVAVEGAVGTVLDATRGDRPERELLRAASDRAAGLGITAVGDMVRDRRVPRAYRDLARDGELGLRVRLNYWTDFLDALEETGLRTDDGDGLVRVGAVKSYTDGSLGARTARLSEPYADIDDAGRDEAPRGQWVVAPDELREYVERADALGLQFCAHAIGDEAIAATLDAYAGTDAAAARHRVEHAEVLTDDLVERFAEVGAVASVQPNFLKWAREGGLYEARLGRERTHASNRYAALREAGVPLAFGSDTMPLGPLFGVQQAVTAPADAQRLDVTEALRAYTHGAAYALRDEDRFGTVEPGKRADLVVLDGSPWAVAPEAIGDIAVTATFVGGEPTYRAEGVL
jgi:predicted amidohydrolase YtcJ